MQQITKTASNCLDKTYDTLNPQVDLKSFAKYPDWHKYYTADSQKRGYIEVGQLTDFWIHTGTRCNLQCPSCFEDSAKNPNRIESISFDETKPLIIDAIKLGAKTFCFTGGEPFVSPEFINILDFALEYAPCLVLSNGTKPLEKYLPKLEQFVNKPHKLFIRVSIDYPIQEKHNALRGQGNFECSLNNCSTLYKMGHTVSIARRMDKDEDSALIDAQFKQILTQFELPEQTSIIAFPDLQISSKTKNPEITETCMIKYKTAQDRDNFMCCHSMMVTKKNGKLCFYPCTLVNDDDSYIQGHNLDEARLNNKVMLRHPRCFACFAHGTSCTNA